MRWLKPDLVAASFVAQGLAAEIAGEVVEEKVVAARRDAVAGVRGMRVDWHLGVIHEPPILRPRPGEAYCEHGMARLVAVEPGPQRVLVDERTAADIDEDRAPFHRTEEALAGEIARVVVERAAEHAVKVEDDAEKHIAKVIERVAKHLERDAKAAASHVLKGLDKLGLDEEYRGKEGEADAERVAKALAKVVDKAEA